MAGLLTHIIQKGLDDNGIARLAGECVNAMGWRLYEQLARQRYIVPLPEGLEPVADAEGRFWDSLETLRRYKRPELKVKASGGDKGGDGGGDDDAPPEAPVHRGGRNWLMPDGTKFSGKKVEALAEWKKRSTAGV